MAALLVRCVVIGRQGDAEVTEVFTFLRGFSALYGSGLALHSEIHSNASDVDALAVHELEKRPIQVNQHKPGELFACISMEEKNFIVFGKTELVQWMKTHLLESRYSSIAPTFIAQKGPPLRLFVSGDRAQVGKSTVCLGLIGSLLRTGYTASDVAYIKPATQCEKPQLVTKFCRQQGVTCVEVGPIVFYRDFTREFLKGDTETSTELLEQAGKKVEEVGQGKKVVIVDGVGYPAVGSICGLSNAHVAKKLAAPVVLVGKKGVGDAVDSFNLNATFFESHGVKVLGGIFNRLPEDGFYSLEHCKMNVTAYFEQFQPAKQVYGFLPELTDGEPSASIAEKVIENNEEESAHGVFLTVAEEDLARKVVDTFAQRIDTIKLLEDARANQAGQNTLTGASKPVVQLKKPKRARNFEIPTSFETMELPSIGTDPVLTSRNKIEIPSSTDTVPLPSFDTVKIP